MKYINIKDTDKIQKGVEEFKKQLMDFSKPEDLPVLYKEVKKTIPWYRRKDFFAYMTYIVLSNTQGGNQRPQDAQNAQDGDSPGAEDASDDREDSGGEEPVGDDPGEDDPGEDDPEGEAT